MFELKPEPQFIADYRQVMRKHPALKSELRAALRELAATGTLPAMYRLHQLANPGGNYNGHMSSISPTAWLMSLSYSCLTAPTLLSGSCVWGRTKSCFRAR